MLYYSFILIQIIVLRWREAYITVMNHIVKLQKRQLNIIIASCRKFTHTGPLFVAYNTLPLYRYNLHIVVYYFKCIN